MGNEHQNPGTHHPANKPAHTRPAPDNKNFTAAEKIVNDYSLIAGAASVIPVPFVDYAAITAVQMKMVHSIGKIYGKSLTDHFVKSTIGSIVGGSLATATGKGIGLRIARSIPFVGGLASILVLPAMAAASTYALGKAFIIEFESGGHLMDLDASAMKATYEENYKNKLAHS